MSINHPAEAVIAASPTILDPVVPAGAPDAPPAQGVVRRLAGRFALLAFGLYHLPLIINDYPSLGGGGFRAGSLSVSWGHVFGQVGLWIARRVFGIAGEMPDALSGDNGDTAEEYCRLLAGVVIAAIAAAAWTWADRRRPRARCVEEALYVLLRYSIVLGLASYAMAKLYPVQFRPLSPTALETRVGELSPMALLWCLMQYSPVYSTIAGIMEMIVVLLLSFRRTAALGAVICIPVMLNVMLMNLCYNVIVKLFSTAIFASAVVLVLYDARRLIDLFVLHRAVPPRPVRPPFRSRRLNQARWVVKLVLVGGVLVSSAVAMREGHARRLADEASSLHGTWRVTSFVVAGRELARTAEPSRWRRLVIGEGLAALRLEDETLVRCGATLDEAKHTLDLACGSTHQDGSLRWTRDANQLRLEGSFDHASVTVLLERRDEAELRLLRDAFRWPYDT